MLFASSSGFRQLLSSVLLMGAVVGFRPPTLSPSFAGAPDSSAAEGRFELELPPEPFVPQQPRSSADQRRLEALALFATARAAQQQEQYETALRLYQRALRRDPKSSAVARAIVPLAFQLKRPAVAVRYALRAVELEEADPLLLRRLGMYLTEQGEWEEAVRLYERAVEARAGEQETAADVLVRMELGRLCHVVERHEQAAEHFARVLHALENPKDFALDDDTVKALLGEPAPTYTLLGDCFLLAGRLDEAKDAYRKAEAADSNRGRFEVQRARVALQADRPKEAIRALQAAFEHKLSPESTTPYRVLVDVLGRLDRTEEVLPRLEALRDKQDDAPALRYVLAEQYLEQGKLEEAAVLYEVLLEQSPTLAGFRGLTATYRRAGNVESLLRVLGELADKVGMLDALGEEGESIVADEQLLGRLIDAAQQHKEASEDGLDHGRALAVALLALEADRFDAAGPLFEAAMAGRPERTEELLVTWGIGLLLGEKPGRAVDVFRRAIAETVPPKRKALYHFYLAGALELDGRTDEALDAARRAAELDPDSPRMQGRLGWVYYHAERYGEAIDAYRRLIERFDADYASTDTRDVLRQARLVLSSLYVLQGDYAKAEPWLEQVLDEFPDEPGALNDLGYLWADQNKNLDLALEMTERAVAAEPENAAFRDSLGWVYYRLGRYEAAVAELEKAAGLEDAPDPTVLDHLGDAYAAAAQKKKAHDAWRRATEAFHAAHEAEKAQAVEKKMADP